MVAPALQYAKGHVHRSAYTLEDQERMSRAENYFAWQSRLVTRELGRRVVEVGCGLGNFTGMLLDREAVIAVDSEPDCIQRLKNATRTGATCTPSPATPAARRSADLARFHADSCVCLNALEHIEDDRQALHGMASILAPGGVVVLLVPAFPALYGPIDSNLGHYRRYSRGSIARLAERHRPAHQEGPLHERGRLLRLVGEFPHSQTCGPVGKADRDLRPLSWSRSCRVWRDWCGLPSASRCSWCSRSHEGFRHHSRV